MSDPALIRETIIEAAAQIKAALDGIGALLDLLECSNPANLALLPLFLAQQKRALAALARMEQSCADVLKEAELQIEYLHERFGRTGSGEAVLARIRALKEQP